MTKSSLSRLATFLRSNKSGFGSKAPIPKELARLDAYSMCGIPVLHKLYELGQDVMMRHVPGDYVECGVYKGGSAASVALALRDSDKRVWLYDSFEGLPEPKAVDGAVATEQFTVGWCKGTEEDAKAALQIAQFPEDRSVIRKGWFAETFQQPLPEEVSFLHIDADWYDSVMLTLEVFYDRVADGGIIVLDDFGHWEGCREAFFDFVANRKLKPLIERFGHTNLFWVKGREHNRDFTQQWEIP